MQHSNALPIAAVSGAVAAAAVSGWFARDAREFADQHVAEMQRCLRTSVRLLLDAVNPKPEPQPQRPQLRLIQGGASLTPETAVYVKQADRRWHVFVRYPGAAPTLLLSVPTRDEAVTAARGYAELHGWELVEEE